METGKIDAAVIGGGMITRDLILPSLYHLQRTGAIGNISVCALNSAPLLALKQDKEFESAFPGQGFTPHPDFSAPPDRNSPDLYKQVLASMPPRQAAVIAMPDQLHYETVMCALEADQHVLCVKPLVLQYRQAMEIEEVSRAKGLFVGVEYHKRFDRRSLIARLQYEQGRLGAFVMGEAKLIEPYYYRSSNFQNWFTTDMTDPFVYIGCHYVDLVYFITGLKPVEVSVSGVKGRFPNGKEGYMWANGRVRFENQAVLSVINGLGYPDAAAGSNDQALQMFFEGDAECGMVVHDDQYRGVAHSYLDRSVAAGARYKYVNPDFFRFVPWEGPGSKPVGYGYDSIAAIIGAIGRIEAKTAGMAGPEALETRRALMKEIDDKGLIATPANSYINELVVEAARMSILSDGMPVGISYGKNPSVRPRTANITS